MRLQPLGHQPYLLKAPTLCLGAPTPRTSILLILGHQPQGLRPSLVKAPTLDLGPPNPRTPILPILRHQPQGLQPLVIYCLDMFSSNSLLPKYSSLNCGLHATSLMTTLSHRRYHHCSSLCPRKISKSHHDN